MTYTLTLFSDKKEGKEAEKVTYKHLKCHYDQMIRFREESLKACASQSVTKPEENNDG